ncbi:hypothetical protein SAMN05428642_102921 [Flaviramulus basaltis]|uniref:Uncharacterized protein n=1 Tax=Flaviramulus basaltis TaxID=369401 RepID=A0A1K2IKG7_9FLAO|nr:hypothetical protein SAMN05428642_102921 [Flaviramulus basaltis]
MKKHLYKFTIFKSLLNIYYLVNSFIVLSLGSNGLSTTSSVIY